MTFRVQLDHRQFLVRDTEGHWTIRTRDKGIAPTATFHAETVVPTPSEFVPVLLRRAEHRELVGLINAGARGEPHDEILTRRRLLAGIRFALSLVTR